MVNDIVKSIRECLNSRNMQDTGLSRNRSKHVLPPIQHQRRVRGLNLHILTPPPILNAYIISIFACCFAGSLCSLVCLFFLGGGGVRLKNIINMLGFEI